VCKARLVCHDDEQSDDVCKAWVDGCWPSVWTNASGLMTITVCVLHVDRLVGYVA